MAHPKHNTDTVEKSPNGFHPMEMLRGLFAETADKVDFHKDKQPNLHIKAVKQEHEKNIFTRMMDVVMPKRATALETKSKKNSEKINQKARKEYHDKVDAFVDSEIKDAKKKVDKHNQEKFLAHDLIRNAEVKKANKDIKSFQKNIHTMKKMGLVDERGSLSVIKVLRDVSKSHGIYKKDKFQRAKKITAKNTWEFVKNSYKDIDEGVLFFFKPFYFVKNLFVNGFAWRQLRKYEQTLRVIDANKDTAKKTVKTAKEKAKDANRVRKSAKVNPALFPAVRKNIKSFFSAMKSTMKSGNSNRPDILAKNIHKNYKNLIQKGQKTPIEFAHTIKKERVPGIGIRFVGKMMVVEILTRGIMQAIEKKKFGAFTETITDSSTLMEAIPGVGLWRSAQRLFYRNDDSEIGLKMIDFGINAIGDLTLMAGVIGGIFSGGATVAGALAVRGGLSALGKGVLKKFSAKKFATSSAKIGIAVGGMVGLSMALDKLVSTEKVTRFAVNHSLTPAQKELLTTVDVIDGRGNITMG